jgi:3-hydroxyacyl-[acyl-carrier-protein] dehydratase
VSPTPAPTTKHRAAPLLAVDSYEIVSAEEIISVKAVRADDPYLEGHYPDFTIYPGVFVIESVVQTARLFVRDSFASSLEAELTAIPSVRFSSPLLPGDTLHIRCRCAVDGEQTMAVKAECHNAAGGKAAQLKLEFRLVKAVRDA